MIVLLAEFIVLFFLSRTLINKMYTLLYLISKSKPISVSMITLALFPGTVIHELSHLFTAEILGVRTGKLVLAPESIRTQDIQVGSVAIAKTGPFRKVLIGLAPLIWGIGAILVLMYFKNIPPLLTFYLLFSISNSMFPSSIDMAGSTPTIVTLILLFFTAFFTGFRLTIPSEIIEATTQNLIPVLAVNTLLLLITHVLIVLTGKIK